MDKRLFWLTLIVLAFWCPVSSAVAQTANAEAMTKDEAGFGFTLAGSLSVSTGNVNYTSAAAGAHAQYQTLYDAENEADDRPPLVRQRVFVNGNGAYRSSSDETIVSRSIEHARWTAMWLPRLGSELFVQHQFDEFSRLRFRALGGVGGRVVLINLAAFQASIGTGYMLEIEEIQSQAGTADDLSTIAHRWTNFLNARLRLFDGGLAILNTVYVQPRFDAFSDVRVLEEVAIDVAVTEVLSLGSALRIAHDSAPPEAVEQTDIEFSQTIKLQF